MSFFCLQTRIQTSLPLSLCNAGGQIWTTFAQVAQRGGRRHGFACSSVWKAVVDVPCNLQRVVDRLSVIND